MPSFWKMHGAGNDFILLDNRSLDLTLGRDTIAHLCHRHFGIGADGLLLVEPAQNGADYRMRYYNSDGGEAEMCGNGARCFARYVNRLHSDQLEKLTFETPAGVIAAQFLGDRVRITLSEPHDLQLQQSLTVAGENLLVHSVNTGVPHAVHFVDDIDSVDIAHLGSAIRHAELFAPAGSNVNFVQILGNNHIALRTYERGVEAETLACGTGIVACAIIYDQLEGSEGPIRVRARGGDTLEVAFERQGDHYHNVTLTGPATFVFEGHLPK